MVHKRDDIIVKKQCLYYTI